MEMLCYRLVQLNRKHGAPDRMNANVSSIPVLKWYSFVNEDYVKVTIKLSTYMSKNTGR